MSGVTLRILVVDDDVPVRRAIARALRSIATVDNAGDADEALEQLEAHTYDAVVSDHSMPGKTGRELLAIVAKKWPDTARILVSAEMITPGPSKSWQAFLAKPFATADLLAVVRALTAKP